MDCVLLTGTRQITMICGRDGGNGGPWFQVGRDGVKSIVVVPVAGNGGFYAWFRVTNADGSVHDCNSLAIEDVEYCNVRE